MFFARKAFVVAVCLFSLGMSAGQPVADHPRRRLIGNGDVTSRIYLPVVRRPLQFVTCPNSTPPPDGTEVQADEAKGFYWPYLLYIPPAPSARQILVIPNNTGYRNDDFCVHRASAIETILGRRGWADQLHTPLLVPIFHRPADIEIDGSVAPQYMGRGMFESYWQTRVPLFARMDLQLMAMMADAASRTAQQGHVSDSTIVMYGHSAGGMTVARFTAAHPELVRAAAFGGHGWLTAPVDRWSGLTLPYPYGVADLDILTGQPFNLAAFRSVPIYSYLGALDNNTFALPWYIGLGVDGQALYHGFTSQFGSTPADLIKSAETVCASVGCSASFRLYPNAGHEITAEMQNDVLAFLDAHASDQ